MLIVCSVSADSTCETFQVTSTTVGLLCEPPARLDCAGAMLEGIKMSDANLTGGYMPKQ
jgi:hypothetical protein